MTGIFLYLFLTKFIFKELSRDLQRYCLFPKLNTHPTESPFFLSSVQLDYCSLTLFFRSSPPFYPVSPGTTSLAARTSFPRASSPRPLQDGQRIQNFYTTLGPVDKSTWQFLGNSYFLTSVKNWRSILKNKILQLVNKSVVHASCYQLTIREKKS